MALVSQWNGTQQLTGVAHDASWFNTYLLENLLYLKTTPETYWQWTENSDPTFGTTVTEISAMEIEHTTEGGNLFVAYTYHMVAVADGYIYWGVRINNDAGWTLPMDDGDGECFSIYYSRDVAAQHTVSAGLPLYNVPAGTYTITPIVKTNTGTGTFRVRENSGLAVLEL